MNNAGWEQYAIEFDSLSDFDTNAIHTGLGLKGLKPESVVKEAKNILDVGCGEGINTFLMHKVNESYVVGIDISELIIDKARQRYQTERCVFLKQDLYSYKLSSELLFDLITFWGSIDYMEINDNFLNTINDLTKIGSRIVMSKFHPIWTMLFGNDTEEMKIDSYFENGRIDFVSYGQTCKYVLNRFHYTISYLINIFKDYRWDLKNISEPELNTKFSSFNYKNYDTDEVLMERMKKIPMTIIMEFERG